MTESNRLRLAYVKEVTIGTTPNTPAMTAMRVTGESLSYAIDTIRSEEIRSDRMTSDLVQTAARVNGGINFELSYGAFDDFIEAAMAGTWDSTPEKDNDGTADSEITAVTDSSDTFTVDAGGTDFKAGHLIRTSGFTNAANNGLFRVASSTGTTIVVGGTPTLTDESAPPGTARIKVVGFRGASGDITATAGGLGSSSLDFTTLGLSVGQWIKVGGSTSGEQFATAILNDWARITAITANALTLDNKPSGWTTDAGSAKTITVYMGDFVRVGTTRHGFTIEKVFLGQSVPSYLVYKGCMVNSMNLSVSTGAILTGSFDILGYNQTISGSALDADVDAAPTNEVTNAVADIGRIAEAGDEVVGPNYITSLEMSLTNNLREQLAVGTMGLIGVALGEANITGTLNTYFGNADLLTKYLNNTAGSINFRVNKSGKGYVMTMPRVKFSSGQAVTPGKNQDIIVPLGFEALLDTVTGTSFQIDRFEEFV